MIIYKQLDSTASSHKLNNFLESCNLDSKDNLHHMELFRIYLHGTSEEMKLVSHYCLIDAVKLQPAILKKNVIQDRGEVANLSYTSLYDSLMYANGHKVRNLIMSVGIDINLKFDTITKPEIDMILILNFQKFMLFHQLKELYNLCIFFLMNL